MKLSVIYPFRLSPFTRQVRMHLSQQDLCQMDLDSLMSLSHEALLAVSERLLLDRKEAHERLAQDPANSSKPSSGQPAYLGLPWDGGASDRGKEADPTLPPRADNALCDEATDGGDETAEPQAQVSVPGKAVCGGVGASPGQAPRLWSHSGDPAPADRAPSVRDLGSGWRSAWHLTLNLVRLDPGKRKGGLKARRLIAATSNAYRAELLGWA